MELIETRKSLLGRLNDWDDDKSWREFFETYWRIIYSSARKAGLDDAEAQEVVQETILSVAKKMKGFQYDPAVGSFKAWLKQLTRRRIIDQYRKRPARRVSLPADDAVASGVSPIEKLPDPASAADAVDVAWEEEWQQNLLDRAIEIVRNEVSPAQFQIFDLHVLRQQATNEVAAALGISRTQVYLAKHRITALLKKTVRRLEKTMG